MGLPVLQLSNRPRFCLRITCPLTSRMGSPTLIPILLVIMMCTIGYGLVEVPKYVEVSSNGDAATKQSSNMGIYKLQDGYHNNFPVWKKEGQELYLFVRESGTWGITDSLDSTSSWIYNIKRNPTPLSPLPLTDGWRYSDYGWKTDDTIRIVRVDSAVASLSSQAGDSKASNCLDGNGETLCHSLKENNAFFMMEYPTPVTVTQVKVLARNNYNANRVKNVIVIITDTEPTKGKPASGTQLGSTFTGPASSGQWISFKSESGIMGKYIVVQQQYKGFLTFAEVEVTQGEDPEVCRIVDCSKSESKTFCPNKCSVNSNRNTITSSGNGNNGDFNGNDHSNNKNNVNENISGNGNKGDYNGNKNSNNKKNVNENSNNEHRGNGNKGDYNGNENSNNNIKVNENKNNEHSNNGNNNDGDNNGNVNKNNPFSNSDIVNSTIHVEHHHHHYGDRTLHGDLSPAQGENTKWCRIADCSHSDSRTLCPNKCSGPQVILIQSEGEATEYQGERMGFFDLMPDQLNSRPVYGQRGGDNFLYFHTTGTWYVYNILGENRGSLHVVSDAILPPISSSSTPWKYSNYGWFEDPSLELVYDPVEDDSCSSVTVSSSGPAGRTWPDYMGTYRWTGQWQTGRKVFNNGEAFLRILTGKTGWSIGNEKNSGGSGIQGGKTTTCPCSLHAGPTVRFNRKGWAYGDSDGEWNDEDASLTVEC